MAICTTFVIMTGGVDLSVGPVLALAGLVSFYCLAGRPAAGVVDPRRAFGRRRRSASLNGAIVALLQIAADHRHARHAQHRARHGADRGRSGAASDPRRAGLHLHRRGQPPRPALLDLHLRLRVAIAMIVDPALHAARPARRGDRRQRARGLSQRPSHPAHQDRSSTPSRASARRWRESSSPRRSTRRSRPMVRSAPSST